MPGRSPAPDPARLQAELELRLDGLEGRAEGVAAQLHGLPPDQRAQVAGMLGEALGELPGALAGLGPVLEGLGLGASASAGGGPGPGAGAGADPAQAPEVQAWVEGMAQRFADRLGHAAAAPRADGPPPPGAGGPRPQPAEGEERVEVDVEVDVEVQGDPAGGAGPSGAAAAGWEEAAAAVSRMPIVEHATRAEMAAWGVGRLKRLLEEEERRRGAFGRGAQHLLEKAELVEALVEARGGSTGDSCAICLAPYESGDPLRVLCCGHRFHVECVDPWLRGSEQHSCPMCQAPIT